ncbi:CinA family protein [candidate division KSB1 bacterium]|nr:CinA family protein [candidate division KSB1 bacterium]
MKDYLNLVELLKAEKLTIATAESCTGGLIAKLITDIPGSSEVFVGGIVSYSNDMKEKWLGVSHETLEKFGAVSEKTISEMLDGLLKQTSSDLGIAVSGIAGPGGGTLEKPVGTVYIGVAFHGQQIISKFIFEGSRKDVRMASAQKGAEMIVKMIRSKSVITQS